MRAVVLHEYGGPEKLKFEDNVSEPQISGSTVLIAAAAASVNPIDWKLAFRDAPEGLLRCRFRQFWARDVSGIGTCSGIQCEAL